MKQGTLELLCYTRPHGDTLALAAADFPPEFSASSTTYLHELELGDYECKPLPTSEPKDEGLWILRWSWTERRMKDVDLKYPNEWSEDETTAQYADTCEWVRPTLDDLARLKALPQERAV